MTERIEVDGWVVRQNKRGEWGAFIEPYEWAVLLIERHEVVHIDADSPNPPLSVLRALLAAHDAATGAPEPTEPGFMQLGDHVVPLGCEPTEAERPASRTDEELTAVHSAAFEAATERWDEAGNRAAYLLGRSDERTAIAQQERPAGRKDWELRRTYETAMGEWGKLPENQGRYISDAMLVGYRALYDLGDSDGYARGRREELAEHVGGRCIACRIEAEIGSREDPHPVPARFHTCVDERAASGRAIDPRPFCIRCQSRWVPPEGVDATVVSCDACARELEERSASGRASRNAECTHPENRLAYLGTQWSWCPDCGALRNLDKEGSWSSPRWAKPIVTSGRAIDEDELAEIEVAITDAGLDPEASPVDAIRELARRASGRATAPVATAWIRCEERMPAPDNEGCAVDVWAYVEHVGAVRAFHKSGEWHYRSGTLIRWEPTHWCPDEPPPPPAPALDGEERET